MAADNIQDRVNEICNDLYSRGEKISVRIVLSMMSDVSSTSTVHKYYKAWRDDLDKNQKDLLDKMGFSPEFSKAFMTEISRHATEAERRYREIADDARNQADEAISELQRVEGFLLQQNQLIDEKDQKIAELTQQLADAIKEGQTALDLQKATFDAADEQRKQQLETALTKCDEQEGTIEQLRRDLAKAELKAEGAEGLTTEVKAQLKAANTEHKQAIKDLNKAHKTEVDGVREQLEAARSRAAQLDTDFALANKDTALLEKATSDIEELTKTVAELQAELHQANENLTERDQKIEALQSQVNRKSRRPMQLSRSQ